MARNSSINKQSKSKYSFQEGIVFVVGGGNSAGQAAVFLSECCRTRTVHLLVRGRLGPSMSDYLVDRIRGSANILVHEGEAIASDPYELLTNIRRTRGKTLVIVSASGRTKANVELARKAKGIG